MLVEISSFLCGFLGSYFKQKKRSYTYAFCISFILYFILTSMVFSFVLINNNRGFYFLIFFCIGLSIFLSIGVVFNMRYAKV